MGRSTSDPARTLRVEHYETWFVRLLEECARHRFAHDPDPFLLHARRALEAAVYAIAERAGAKTASVSLEDLLKDLAGRGELPRERMHDFQAMRTRTNRAAHVPPRDAPQPEVERVADALLDVIRWVDASKMCQAPDFRHRIELARDGIDGTTRAEAPDVELDRLRRTSRRPPAGGAVASRPSRRPGLIAFGFGVVAAAALGWFGRSLTARFPTSDTTAVSAPSFTGASSTPQAASAPPTAATGRGTESRHAVGVADPVPDDARPDDAFDTSEASEHEVPRTTTTVTAAPACPEGMLFVEGGEVTLAPPNDRPTWPVRRGRARTLSVEAFCIARAPCSQQDFERCSEDGACAPRGRVRGGGASDSPVTFISQNAGRSLCRHRFGESAGLPTMAQLERLARTDQDVALRVATRGGPFEWSADECSAAFEASRAWVGVLTSQGRLSSRMPEPHPRLSWHCRPRPDGTAHDQVRCTAPPLER